MRVKRLEKPIYCRKCVGITRDGQLCKRDASCRLGCKYFCWQHAKMFEKGKLCVDKKIKRCVRCNDSSPKGSSRKTPCMKKRTVFRTKREFNDYCRLLKAKRVPEGSRVQRKIRLKKAQRELRRESMVLKKKTRAHRKVHFE